MVEASGNLCLFFIPELLKDRIIRNNTIQQRRIAGQIIRNFLQCIMGEFFTLSDSGNGS